MGINSARSELKQWHTVTLDFSSGQSFSENDPATFRNHRLDVTFTHADGTRVTVPGYFAANGDAGNSGRYGEGAEVGNVWRAHFNPPKTGTWTYEVNFVTGTDVAVGSSPGTGVGFDGTTGAFNITSSNKTGVDFRGKGVLVHEDGDRYLTFQGTGESFIKGGPGSPENFLAFDDFDGTVDLGGVLPNFLHRYQAHLQHARPGDPVWAGDEGNGAAILGALNYLASQGLNSLYMLTMTRAGDGEDVWPWATPDGRTTFDVSKLDQWHNVFQHAQKLGIHLHLLTQEQENDQLLDGGALGVERMLYYRELVARFAHINGVTWNLGEENSNTYAQRKQFATHIRDLDPYDHPIALHTFPSQKDPFYGDLLGFKPFDNPTMQIGDGHGDTLKWIDQSKAAGHPWVVTFDEFGGVGPGVRSDQYDPYHPEIRSEYLWGNLMAGGAGVEYYSGYQNAQNDLNIEDFSHLKNMWAQNGHALAFFNNYLPFDEMVAQDQLLPQNAGLDAFEVDDYAFAQSNKIYAVYLKEGGSSDLDLRAASGTFSVHWFDPRNGGPLLTGSVGTVSGGDLVDLGEAPKELGKDWVALVRKIGGQAAPDIFDIRISRQADRSASQDLDDAVLQGPAHIFLQSSAEDIDRVRFWIDGKFTATEETAPWDLLGGTAAAAKPLYTRSLGEGSHTLRAEITTYSDQVFLIEDRFVVDNIPDGGSRVTLAADPDVAGAGVRAWGSGVTLQARSHGNGNGELSYVEPGFGVIGGSADLRLDYNAAAASSEAIFIDFNESLTSVELTLGRFGANDGGGIGETAKWLVRNSSGAIVGSGNIDKNNAVAIDGATFKASVTTIQAFETLELRAGPYGYSSASYAVSDFTLDGVSFWSSTG